MQRLHSLIIASFCFLLVPSVTQAALYVSDAIGRGSGWVKRIDASGNVTPYAQISDPRGLAALPGALYVADPGSLSVFRFDTSVPVSSYAPFAASIGSPGNAAVDATTSQLYLSNGATQILRIDAAGNTVPFGLATDIVNGLGVDRAGNVYASELSHVENDDGDLVDVGRIERWSRTGVKSTFYQSAPTAPLLASPGAIAFNTAGDLLVADRDAATILRIAPDGTPSLFYSFLPKHIATGLTFDASGTLYASVLFDHKIVAFGPSSSAPVDFAVSDLVSPGSLAVDPPLDLPEPSGAASGLLAVLAILWCRRSRTPRFHS